MSYLLDADWVIQALRGREPVVSLLPALADQGLAICPVTIAEVYEGAFGVSDHQAHLATYRRFLAPVPVLPLHGGALEHFARIRSDLRARGQLIPDFDLLVAATALHYGLTLLTFNVRPFGRIPELDIYNV
ncbi:MAG: type II toxin-antitoxin system VapC family toxin [Chloroflexota bacterium]|nr:MAG: type II toxin-antitoxin system VapC family toxin [Chloroflexota bacterium]